MVEGDCDEVRNTPSCGRTSCARLFTNVIININVDICLKNIKSRERKQKYTGRLCCQRARRWLTSGSIESAHSLALSMQPKRAQDRFASIKSRTALGEILRHKVPTPLCSVRASIQTAQDVFVLERTSPLRSLSLAAVRRQPCFHSASSLHCRRFPVPYKQHLDFQIIRSLRLFATEARFVLFSNYNIKHQTEIFHSQNGTWTSYPKTFIFSV